MVFLFCLGLLGYQIMWLLSIPDIRLKSSDQIGPLYSVLGLLTNLAAVLAYGKPYEPAYFSGGACLLSVLASCKWNGLWEWSDKTSLLVVPLYITGRYLYIGWWCGRRRYEERFLYFF